MPENYKNQIRNSHRRTDLLPLQAYDIALLRLETDVDLSHFTPACLARADDTTTFNYEKAISLGEKYWGISGLVSFHIPSCF